MSRLTYLFIFGFLASSVYAASISNKPNDKIENNEELLSSIISDCFGPSNTMACLKEKVLTYLDTILGYKEESRSFSQQNIDEIIFNRVARILATNEIKVKLPNKIFEGITIKYNTVSGLDLETQEGRGHLLKKKLLFPVLLLLKLKMKALMPILVALVGFKAMKAYIMAKLALTLVIGFLVSQLVKKIGMKMPMQMNPMQMMQPPQPEYGAPIPPTTGSPSASYESSNNGWEGSNYNSRVWDSSNLGASHNLAYSGYYNPSSSSNLASNTYTGTGSSYSSYSAPLASSPTSSSLTSSTSSTSSSTSAHAY
ncbi:uncharacterized protein LOC134835315 [Culicoides brevitarsis]|uniref:uncharacterized protein LOC134835315 n=1 Tax=Culicoides brevitarsis TaxID=469753 RepID=UPI00307BA7FC